MHRSGLRGIRGSVLRGAPGASWTSRRNTGDNLRHCGYVLTCPCSRTRPLLSGARGGAQGRFLVRSLVDGAGSYSVAHRAGLLPTELTGMWGWILLRSPHQGKGSAPAPAPTKQTPE